MLNPLRLEQEFNIRSLPINRIKDSIVFLKTDKTSQVLMALAISPGSRMVPPPLAIQHSFR